VSDTQEFKAHFNDLYLTAIPRLLDDEGLFLALLVMLTAVDSLSGAFAPEGGTGERFRAFIRRYFPDPLNRHADSLWECRTRMVHSMHPGPFALVCGQPQLQLTPFGKSAEGDVLHLNAQDVFTALAAASESFFSDLEKDETLQRNFRRRMNAKDGGAPETQIGLSPPGA
jgi:hypothetical protein